MVRDNTVVCPGSDAAVLRIKEDSLPAAAATQHATHNMPEKFIALSVDGNGAYVYLDPYEGGKIVVAEAARNLACSGAAPLGRCTPVLDQTWQSLLVARRWVAPDPPTTGYIVP